MTSSDTVGCTAALWRFPVKSMLGEQVASLELTTSGFVGDRAYALIDAATGKVVSAKSVKEFPTLFECRATFVESPSAGIALPPVRITRADGTSVTSDAASCDATLSRWFGRDVHLGLSSSLVGAFFDAFPVTLLTTSTLDTLNKLRPESQFDERRFRMNIIVDTDGTGFVENGWVGRGLAAGDDVRLHVAVPDARCVMTTLAQEDLPKDAHILQTLTRHNRLDIGGGDRHPCAGVYAVVESPGTVRAGDPIVLR